jgi:predicted nuclease of restriction endonuclease-like (RecB) superfamily
MSEVTNYRDAAIEIKDAILQSRYRISAGANIEQLTLYYSVGRYISANTRTGKWGTDAIETISALLQGELPGIRGYSPTNMKNMRLFFEEWMSVLEANRQLLTAENGDAETHLEIRQLPTAELSDTNREAFLRTGFTHHREILRKAKSLDERWYYIHRCAAEFWNVTTLKNHLQNDDYRVLGKLPNNFTLAITDVDTAYKAVKSFKDEYLFDYIRFENPNDYDEDDIQDASIADIKKFILTIGNGFCFVANEYRMIVGDDEFFTDMLFFHRDLQCLVAFDFKRGKFTPKDLGQLSFYLAALDKYVKRPHENNTIGILLCKEANQTVAELAVQSYKNPLGVATYKIGNDMPEKYRSLKTVVDGVQQILLESGGNSEEEAK